MDACICSKLPKTKVGVQILWGGLPSKEEMRYRHIYIIALSNKMLFDNANGIQVVDHEESFRMQLSKVIFVLHLSRYGRFRFGMAQLQLHH